MKQIYLDNAATTKLDEKVKEKMVEVMEVFGNPSSLYDEAFRAKRVMNEARNDIAQILNAQAQEIIFTGSGTESDNLAIFGVVRNYQHRGKHIITTEIEHPAVLRSFEQLEREGFEVSYLKVGKDGVFDVETLKNDIRDDTIFISVMYANNEIGTIQPIAEIAEFLKERSLRDRSPKPIFHTDACQATNYLSLDVQKLGVDLMTFSGSKIYGPKGIGVLYKSEAITLEPLIFGGGQEFGLRSGTENVFLMSGIAEALTISEAMKEQESERLTPLRDYFIEQLEKEIDSIIINGSRLRRLPNNIHIAIERVEGEALLLMLDAVGISAATGSACSSKDLNISHVLTAIGVSDEIGHGSLRFSLGRDTQREDIDFVVQELKKIVTRLRSFSAV